MKQTFLTVAAAILAVGCSEPKATRQKAPIRVRTEIVIGNGIDTKADGTTYVGVVEEAEATAVSFTTMGTVKRILVSEGQHVSRGQLIAELDDTQARNLLTGAEAAMAQANDALQRYGMLHDEGSLPEVKWVELQSKVAQAKSQVEVARKNLADCRLTSPVSGIVGRKSMRAGETAMPSQAVATILDISSVRVKFSVPEAEVAHFTPSTHVAISVDAIGRQFESRRIEKGVQADALTHTYDLRAHVYNKEALLLPGMVARVSVSHAGDTQGAAITVPLTAVQRKTDGTMFVWTVAADSTAHRTAVSIGASVGNAIEVTSGIGAGAHIVTEGYQKLSEGSRVVEN